MRRLLITFLLIIHVYLFSSEEITLQLRWDHQFQFAGYYAALWEGYYEDAGLKVEIKSALTEDGKILSPTEEVSKGNADFGIGAADILLANDKGSSLVVNSVIFQQSAAMFYSLGETEFNSLYDMLKLKVARNLNDLIDIELQAMVRAEGINSSNITAYQHKPGFQHLLDGSVDILPGYSISVPYELNKINVQYKSISPSEYGIDFYGDSLFSSKEFVKNNREIVLKFIEASHRGWAYALENSDEIASLISRGLERKAEVEDFEDFNRFQISGVRELTLYPFVSLGNINPHRWEMMFQSLKETGLVVNDLEISELIYDTVKLKSFKNERLRSVGHLTGIIVVCILLFSIFFIFYLRRNVLSTAVALLDSEEKYRIVSEHYPEEYMGIVEADYTISLITGQGLSALTKNSNIDIAEINLNHLFGEEIQQIRQALKSTFNGDKCQIEHFINNQFLLIKTLPIRSESGVINRITFICEDITEMKRKESLKKAQYRFIDYSKDHSFQELLQYFLDEAEFITGSKMGVYHFLEEDQQILSLQACSSNTLNDIEFSEELNTRYPLSEAGAWGECVKQDKPIIHNDYRYQMHKGWIPEELFMTRELVVPVKRDDIIVAVLGVGNKETDYHYSDIDSVQQLANIAWETINRKRAEEELREARIERQRLMSAIEQTQDTVVVTDLEGNVLYTNPVFEKTSGYSREEVLGNNIGMIKSHFESPSLYDELWNTVTDKNPWFGKIQNRKKDGTLYTEEVCISPVLDQDRKIISYVGVKRDITNNLELMKEQSLLHEQLSQRSKIDAIGLLAGGMAHDFNNVLSGILSAAQLLKSPMIDLNDQAKKYVDLIFQASKRGSDLTSRLLSFGRKELTEYKNLDLNKVINDICEILKRTIDKRISIEYDLQADDFIVFGDISSFQNALINLGINASHAISGEGEIKYVLKNIYLGSDKYCQVEVIDNGCGIPELNLSKIFEPFYTTKDIDSGTGLGLSVVKSTVADHKGTIDVISQLGFGSTFTIVLPANSHKIQSVSTEDEKIIPGKGTILFVDDEKLNRITGNDILKSLGYDVIEAVDGADALLKFEESKIAIDLIILDMIMPGLNGTETFHKLMELDNNCRVIITSGYINNENIEELINKGLSGFIHKPYRVHELSQLISKVLH